MMRSPRNAVFVASFFVVGASMLACGTGDAPTMTAVPTSTPSIADIERWARLEMPASAQDIQAYVDPGGLDALVVMTFKLPPQDLQPFLDAAGYPAPLQVPDSSRFVPGYYEEFDKGLPGKPDSAGLPWWPSRGEWDRMLQESDRVLRLGHVFESSFSRSILVDQTDGDLYTIYLYHSEV
jgi:hypothetical protein